MAPLFKTVSTMLMAAFAVFAPEPQQGSQVEKLEGKAIPAFTMKTIGDKTISNKSLKGKPYILDFWASWCGPCKKASPLMQSLHKEYAKKGLVVIGANGLEDKPGPEAAKEYAKAHKYTYTFTHSNDDLMSSFGIQGVPTFIFVNKSGTVVKVMVGYGTQSDAKMKELAATLVKK